MKATLQSAALRRAARTASDWVDLQWSLLWAAFQVARIGGLAQAMGKLSHEGGTQAPPRVWTLPVVAPLMVGLSGGARVLDRFFVDPDESMGFLILARRKQAA